MAEQAKLTGPDLGAGVDANTVRDGEPLLGHANGEAVLPLRCGDDFHAIGATCTHYGGLLVERPSTATKCAVRGTTPASTCGRQNR